ncbi:RHS repeat-associated core domain-containing protein [Streptomyces griseoflavus]|uniref:RHS repeat-associated core domain-containing protein n=1 Tax=Streptomyces griseoflavus TaxID=35619 RepID=UPI003F6845F7
MDPTGLYKMGHRYYDPTLGRFTQPDPSGQETNAYLYAAGDPVNNTDPTGLAPSAGEITVVTLGVISVATGVGGALATGAVVAQVLGGISLTTGIAGGVGSVACMFSDGC